MESKKKVEVIIEKVQIPAVLEMVKICDISGFTLIRDVQGSGGHGLRDGLELTDILNNSYLMVVCEADKAACFIKRLRPLLKSAGGIVLVTDIIWIEH